MKTLIPLALSLVLATVPLLPICHGQELHHGLRPGVGCSESHVAISTHCHRYPRRALYDIHFKRDLAVDIPIGGLDDLTPVPTPVSTPAITPIVTPIVTSTTDPTVTSPATGPSTPATPIGGTTASEATSVGPITSSVVVGTSTTVQATTPLPATTNPVSLPPPEPTTKDPPPVVVPPVITPPVATPPVVNPPTQPTTTSGQVTSTTTGISSTLSVSPPTSSFPVDVVKPSDTASANTTSGNSRTALMIGVIIVSIAIISGVVVWTFRKIKLSPSTQFKSKIRDSSHEGAGAIGSGHDDEDNEGYPNIFRPPAHSSEIPRAESVASTGSSPRLKYLECDLPNDQPQHDAQHYGHQQYVQYGQPYQQQNDTQHGSEQYSQRDTTVAIESNPFRDSTSLNTGMLEAVLGHIPRSHVSFGSQDFGAYNEHYLRGLRE